MKEEGSVSDLDELERLKKNVVQASNMGKTASIVRGVLMSPRSAMLESSQDYLSQVEVCWLLHFMVCGA
jgi:hypothetical protein